MSKTFMITFAGDTSLGEWYLKKSKNQEYINRLDKDPISFFRKVMPIVNRSDYFILNFESVLSENPDIIIKDKEYPNWDQPQKMLNLMKHLNVNAVSLANNHTMDFGHETMLSTKKQLESAMIGTFGAGENRLEASKPLLIQLEGTQSKKNVYVFTGMNESRRYTEEYNFFAKKNAPGICALTNTSLSGAISLLRREEPDAVIIVTPHWQGFDYKWASENLQIQELCRSFIDSGANFVFGHGPHALNDIEIFKDGIIVFSIGNFIFNSPGRYKKFDIPPYSLIVKLHITEDNGKWELTPRFFPIMTDNRNTGYQVAPLGSKKIGNLSVLLNEKALREKKYITYHFSKEESGPYFIVEINPKPSVINDNEILGFIAGNKSLADFDFNDPVLIQRHLNQLPFYHDKIDSDLRKYYDLMTKSPLVKNNEFNSLEKVASHIKRQYVSHRLLRLFERNKLTVAHAISFSDIMIENSALRKSGYPEYAWRMDEKTNAYKFMDVIGISRPKSNERTFKFKEIQKPDSPVVVKPVKSTGSMGVYLLFKEDKILSARESTYLRSWEDVVKDATRKIDAGRVGKNSLLRTDKWMIEELILSEEGSIIPPNDLKFYCFYGEVILILESNRAYYKKYCFWDNKMNLVETGKYMERDQIYEDGKGFTKDELDQVISISLQIPAPFVRLDMLKSYTGLVFGEATPRPGRFHQFNPKYDRELGEAYRQAEGRIMRDLLSGKKFKAFTDVFGV